MSNSTNLLSAVADSVGTPAYLVRTYGEPLFHTESDVTALRFSEDGLLWTIEESGLLRQWTVQGRQVSRLFLSDLENVWRFSPTGKFLASGSEEIALWYVNSGQVAFRHNTGSWITALTFSTDGNLLASGHDDGSLCLWDVRGLKLLKRIEAHNSAISSLSFRSNGQEVASAGEDRKIRVWKLGSLQPICTLLGHPDRIPALAWQPNTDLLLSAGWDTTVRVWQPPNPEPKMLLNSHSEQVSAITFNASGTLLACADSDFEIHVWDNLEASAAKLVFHGHTGDIQAMAFSPDGNSLASSGADRTIRMWNLTSGAVKAGAGFGQRHRIALLPSPKHVNLFSAQGNTIQAWEADSAQPAWIPNPKEPIRSLAASPDGRWIATSSEGPEVQLWDTEKKQTSRTLPHTRGPIDSLCFSPDSKRLATASVSDGLVWIWDLNEKEAVLVVPEAADACTLETLVFDPSGQRLAVGGIDFLSTGGSDGAICVWDLPSKEKIKTFERGVTALHYDPKGRYLAAGVLNFSTVVWDMQEDKIVFDLPGHTDRIGTVIFSPDGSWLVSASDDCTIRIWNVLNGRLVIARNFDTAIQSLAFSPDGKFLYTGNADSTCYRLAIDPLIED